MRMVIAIRAAAGLVGPGAPARNGAVVASNCRASWASGDAPGIIASICVATRGAPPAAKIGLSANTTIRAPRSRPSRSTTTGASGSVVVGRAARPGRRSPSIVCGMATAVVRRSPAQGTLSNHTIRGTAGAPSGSRSATNCAGSSAPPISTSGQPGMVGTSERFASAPPSTVPRHSIRTPSGWALMPGQSAGSACAGGGAFRARIAIASSKPARSRHLV